MTVHHARSIALAAVLVGISALAPTTRLHAQQTLADREQLLRDAAAALAEQGYPLPSFALGGMYADGQGVPQDDAEAVRWYRLAADQGHSGAQNGLGLMYSNGEGVPQDYAESARWYRLAAEQGEASSQQNLGFLYDTGRGVPQDHAEAARWYRLGVCAPERFGDLVVGNCSQPVPQEGPVVGKAVGFCSVLGHLVGC